MIPVAKHTVRHAITLVEVIFSIGVILIGLLGLMSILPLAGRRAQDSISLSVGAEMSEAVFDELRLRQFLANDRLLPIPARRGAAGYEVSVLDPTNVPALPLPQTMPAFCIDPIFASTHDIPTSVSPNGYNAALFPYFQPTHDPMLDPSVSSTGMTSPDPSTVWPVAQPRMVRVGINDIQVQPIWDPSYDSHAKLFRVDNLSGTTFAGQFLTAEESLLLVENLDNLPVLRPDDRTVASRFLALSTGASVSDASTYGKRVPTGEFTWIATVNPLPGNVYASVAVVVIRDRERTFQVPTAITPPDTPRGNATSERLAYVSYASGFSGGSGGVVHLVSAGNTVSKLRTDDWGDALAKHRWRHWDDRRRLLRPSLVPRRFGNGRGRCLSTS